MRILKVTKNQGFILSLEDKFMKNPKDGFKLTHYSLLRVKPFINKYNWEEKDFPSEKDELSYNCS